MSYQELDAIFTTIKFQKRSEWEQWRMQCYYSIRPFLKEEAKPKDLILPWDDEGKTQKKLTSAEDERVAFERMTGQKLKT